jgi:predicted lactoylglutathione lyase
MAKKMDKEKPVLSDVLIELHVPDFGKVKRFYSAIGFKVVRYQPAKDKMGYLAMRRGNSIICFYCGSEQVFNQSHFKKFPKTTPRGYGVEILIFVKKSDIERLHSKVIKEFGTKVVVGTLQDRWWGCRDFRVVDPFGYYLRISEPKDNLVNPKLPSNNT